MSTRKQSYTGGPLIAGPESDDGVFGVLTQSGHSIGCAMLAADARLWAAAPEMAEALREWAGLTRSPSDGPMRPSQAAALREKTRALLAKIDGDA